MSIRECIQVFHPVDTDKYLELLETEYGARANPEQLGTFLIGKPEVPFHKPKLTDGRMSILGFNLMPLSDVLVEALFNHPDLAQLTAMVLWTAEQEVVTHGTLAKLKLEFEKRS